MFELKKHPSKNPAPLLQASFSRLISFFNFTLRINNGVCELTLFVFELKKSTEIPYQKPQAKILRIVAGFVFASNFIL